LPALAPAPQRPLPPLPRLQAADASQELLAAGGEEDDEGAPDLAASSEEEEGEGEEEMEGEMEGEEAPEGALGPGTEEELPGRWAGAAAAGAGLDCGG
jgi:hypothetical protein